MDIENIIVSVETEVGSMDGLYLNMDKSEYENRVLHLVTSKPAVFYKKLLTRKPISFNGDINEVNNIVDENEFGISSHQVAVLNSFVGEEIYLSFFSLSYRSVGDKLDQVAPLFFVPVILEKNGEGFELKMTSSTPLFNHALIKRLKETYELDLKYQCYDFQLESYKDFINKKSSAFFFKVCDDVCLIKCSAKELYRRNLLNENVSEVYNSWVISSINGTKLAESDGKDDFVNLVSAYPFITKAYSILEEEHCVNLRFSNQKVEDSVLKRITIENIAQGKSVHIYGLDDKFLNKFKNDEELKFLLLDPKEHNNYIVDLIEKEKKVVINGTYHEGNIKEYAEVLKKRDACFAWPFNQNREEFLEELANYTALGTAKYDLDVNGYDDEEYAKDRLFFKEFAKLSSLKNISINQHPFYGLTSRIDNDTYSELINSVKTCLEDLNIFTDKLEQSKLNEWNLGTIESFYDYIKVYNHFEVLRQYSGFKPEYFDLDVHSVDLDALGKLKNLYDSRSSLHLALDSIASPEIWVKDFDELNAEYKGKRKEKKQAVKKILPLLKIKDKKNINSFFRLIGIYVQNNIDIAENKGKLSNINAKLDDIDSIIELESAIEYVGLYSRHTKLYDDIDFENNVMIKKYFADQQFRSNFNDMVIDELVELANKLQLDFDNIYAYFDAAEKKDYEMMPFAHVKYLLRNLINANYDVYIDYYNFIAYSKTVSSQLNEVLDRLIAEKLSFKNLEVDFFASMFSSYKKKSFVSASSEFEKLSDLRHDFIQSIDNQIADDKNNLLLKIQHDIEDYKLSEDYKAFIKDAKKLAVHLPSIRNDVVIRRFSEVVLKLKPLIVGKYSSYLTSDIKTDVAIIIDPESYCTADLLLMITLAKKVIFVTHKSGEVIKLGDSSILIEEVMKCINVDLNQILSGYSYPKMGEHLFNLVEYSANSLGYQLQTDYEYEGDNYPLVLLRPGVKKPVAMLFNDLTMKEDFEKDLENLFPIIHRLIGIDCFEFPLFIAALNPRGLIKDIVGVKGSRDILMNKIVDVQDDNKPTPVTKKVGLSQDDYEARLKKIRESLIERPIYSPDDEVSRDDIDGYIFAVLPLSLEDYHSLKPLIKSKFNEYYKRGLIKFSENHFFPFNLDLVTLRPGIGDVNRVTDYELRKSIFTYLTNFTYMKLDNLVDILAEIIATDDRELLSERVMKVVQDLHKHDMVSIEDGKISLYKSSI